MTNIPRQDQNSVVAVFSQHSTAENTIKELKGGGLTSRSWPSSAAIIKRKRMLSVSIIPATE